MRQALSLNAPAVVPTVAPAPNAPVTAASGGGMSVGTALVILFVIVLLITIAAVVHHLLKKRSQKVNVFALLRCGCCLSFFTVFLLHAVYSRQCPDDARISQLGLCLRHLHFGTAHLNSVSLVKKRIKSLFLATRYNVMG